MPAYTPEDADRLLCEAISAGDLEATLAFYEPEARFVVAPGNVLTGSEAIRQVMSEFLALRPTLTLEKVTALQTGTSLSSPPRGPWRVPDPMASL